jgi:hypothetical protein
VRLTEWLAWVDVLEDSRDIDGPRVRMYVTHGIPFLQLTLFRSAGARYTSCEVAQAIAAIAAGTLSPYGAEQGSAAACPGAACTSERLPGVIGRGYPSTAPQPGGIVPTEAST